MIAPVASLLRLSSLCKQGEAYLYLFIIIVYASPTETI
jgi:hypothetical protein